MSKKPKKCRADLLLVEGGLAENVERAKALILAGVVLANGTKVLKPGEVLDVNSKLNVKSSKKFVSRGAEKLLHALDSFSIDVSGKVCADIGSSTGGFTDVLCQQGAAKVYAIDSAYGELDWKLRSNERVIVMERTNILQLESLPESVDLITVDVSLLSILNFLPRVMHWLAPEGKCVVLVKPQYEVSKSQLPPGAVIRDSLLHQEILHDVTSKLESEGVMLTSLTTSPILGGSGNREFLALFEGNQNKSPNTDVLINEACRSNDPQE